jgi:outer membrane protein assembly factor BamB
MSRTVPAITDQLVVAIGPKCHVACLEATSGELRWGLDLVRQYGATVPQWYTGQCPLIDQGSVILAPGGKDALLVAVNAQTGQEVWRSRNPHGWKMTHSSIMPLEFAGERMYVYCANNGVVGVSAKTGALLWETPDWKISIATVPSPLILDGGRIFLTGGYNAGSLMLQLKKQDDKFTVEPLFRLVPEVFGATQHTPVVQGNYLYGVRADGKFTCLTLEGKPVWTSDPGQQFGLGPFLLADGVIFALNDSGLMRLIEATPDKYHLLGQAQVLKGHDAWGPLALAGGRLIARDLTRMVCLDVAQH